MIQEKGRVAKILLLFNNNNSQEEQHGAPNNYMWEYLTWTENTPSAILIPGHHCMKKNTVTTEVGKGGRGVKMQQA